MTRTRRDFIRTSVVAGGALGMTARDTVDWYQSLGDEQGRRMLSPEREAEVVEAWRTRGLEE